MKALKLVCLALAVALVMAVPALGADGYSFAGSGLGVLVLA